VNRVAIAGAASLFSTHRWDASAGDLAVEAASGLVEPQAIDTLFVAAPAAGPVDGQTEVAPVVADRLGLGGGVTVYEVASGGGTGALHAAFAHVRAGLAERALVLGIAKVADLAEGERGALMDSLIDREAEAALGLTYAALAGLLADLYVARYADTAGTFAQVVAKNAANAVAGGETLLTHAPTVAEIRRDIPVAPPLVRSDFAPLVDGAVALLVTERAVADTLTDSPVELLAVGASTDGSVVADRADPLRLDAVARAARVACGSGGLADAAFVELDNACSVLEVLAVESLGLVEPGATGARYRDGFGRIASALAINPGGGAQGKGYAFGASGLEQVREAYLQLSGRGQRRQVPRAAREGARGVCVAVSGLGSAAYATLLGRTR
jgi:acetyl-CoA acetyltransferase